MGICTEFINTIYDEINEKLVNITDKTKKPHLAVVQVGNDPASTIYIKFKRRACRKLVFGFQLFKYNNDITTDELIKELNQINEDKTITGCIVQLPLPNHINKFIILNTVDPKKDVDCFNSLNVAKLYLGANQAYYIPATPLGIYKYIKFSGIDTKGKCCVILGKSTIVGRPLQLLLSDEEDMACTTILCDKYTINPSQYIKLADILIVAANKHHLINNPNDLKDNVIIIDVGIHRIFRDGIKYVEGDVDYNAVKHKCKLITPVPGGVGPMTVASLMFNLAKPFFKETTLKANS